MKKTCLTVALFLLLPAFAVCQSATGASPSDSNDAALAAPVPLDQQPSKEDLNKLLEAMHLRQEMQKQLQMMPQLIQQQLQQQWKQMSDQSGAKLKPDQQAELEKVMQKYMVKALNVYSIDQMIADIIPIYQRHFTKDDVNAMIAFYDTPAGQHMLAVLPVIMQEYMPIAMKRVQESTAMLTDGLVNDMSAYLKTIQPASGTDSK